VKDAETALSVYETKKQEEEKVDTVKFKSVAVRVQTYQVLKKLAKKDNRSAGMQITHLVEKEDKRQRRRAA
jgi:hypothetical protein